MSAKRFLFAACAAAAALSAAPQRVAADPARAWAAAKDHLPAATALVVGADLTQVTKSQTFNQLLPLALAQEPDARKLLDTIKSSCKIDPMSAIHGVVIAADAERKHGAVYLSLGAGLDQGKLTKCFEEVAKTQGSKDAKLGVKKIGAVTELTLDAKEKVYVSWIGADVLVIPFDAHDKAALEKWFGQKGGLAKSPIAKLHGSANKKAAVWGASAIASELEPGVSMKAAHGALTMAGGNLTIDLRTTLDSPKAAADAVAKANAQIAQVSGMGQTPAGVKTMLKSVSLKAAGADVTIKATVPESELISVLSLIGP